MYGTTEALCAALTEQYKPDEPLALIVWTKEDVQDCLAEYHVTEIMAARIVAEGMSVRATEEAVTLSNRADNEIAPPQKRKPIVMPGLQDVAEHCNPGDAPLTFLGGWDVAVKLKGGAGDDFRLWDAAHIQVVNAIPLLLHAVRPA